MINDKKKRNSNSAVEAPQADNTQTVLRPAIIKSVVAIALLVAVVLTYILLPAELKGSVSSGGTEEESIVLLDGEVMAGTSAIYVFEPVTSSTLQSIEVENTNCSYTLTKSSDGGFYLDGNEQMTYSDSAFSTLIVATGNTVTSERIYPDLYTGQTRDSIPWSSFGLDEAGMNARYTLTTTDGNTYTVRVGDLAPNGEGYYACLEGREAVYILDKDLQTTVLGTTESIVDPTLGLQGVEVSSEENNAINHLTVWQHGKHVTTIHSADGENIELSDDIYNYAMSCNQDITVKALTGCKKNSQLEALIGINAIPYDYVPGNEEYNEIASNLPNLTGEETVALKDAEAGTITAEQLLEFGIDMAAPAYEIFYSYNNNDEDLDYNHIVFSEQVDGYYYAYSNLNKIIAKVPADSVNFLEWNYSQWIEPHFFQKYITSISEIKIKSDKVDYTFSIEHGADEEGTATLTASESGNRLDTQNFRNFYRTILTRNIRGAYVGEIPDLDDPYLSITITNTEEKVTEYKFYRATTQQAYITINGKGEFYCLNSSVRKIENDAIKLVAGEEVSYEDWN